MTNLDRSLLCTLVILCSAFGGFGQTNKPLAKKGDLVFSLRPVKPVFQLGSDVTMVFTFKNVSKHRVLATRRAALMDLTYLDVIDQFGRSVLWQGVIDARGYPEDFFVILKPGQSVTFRGTISYAYKGGKKRGIGAAYQIERTGSYRVRAIFSLAPKEYFALISKGAAVPDHNVISNSARFSVVSKAPKQTRR